MAALALVAMLAVAAAAPAGDPNTTACPGCGCNWTAHGGKACGGSSDPPPPAPTPALQQPVHQPFDVYWDMHHSTEIPNPTVSQRHDRRKVFMSPEVVKLGLRGSNWTANPHAWGLWPTIVGMKPGGKLVNGGVPQNGNLSLHLATIREDFATPWPVWKATGDLSPRSVDLGTEGDGGHTSAWDGFIYVENGERAPNNLASFPALVNLSETLVKAAHPEWPASKVTATAEAEYTAAQTQWMAATLEQYTKLRPHARVGYWAMPDPGKRETVNSAVYAASTVLYPECYYGSHCDTDLGTPCDPPSLGPFTRQACALRVQTATKLAAEQNPKIPVMAYATAYFHGYKYLRLLNATHLRHVLQTAYDPCGFTDRTKTQPGHAIPQRNSTECTGADGVFFWGANFSEWRPISCAYRLRLLTFSFDSDLALNLPQ